MFSIKHVKADGSEEILFADRVRYIPDAGDAESFGSAGVYLDPEDNPPGLPSGAAHIIPISRSGSTMDRATPSVYVMNRNGATVATYRL